MNLLSQTKVNGYDTFDSCVVAAVSEEEARSMHPSGGFVQDRSNSYSWPTKGDDVKVTLLGVAVEGTAADVVCASFNAG